MRRLVVLCSPTNDSEQSAARVIEELLDEIRGHAFGQPPLPEAAEQRPESGEAEIASVRELPLRSVYGFADVNGLAADASRIRSATVPKRVQGPPYRRALFAQLLEERGLLQRFIQERWPHGSTEDGQRRLKAYRRLLERHRSSSDSAVGDGWVTVERLSGVIVGPEDLAVEHDHYLYGSPRQDTASQ
jgi:hypothetical protein